MQEQSRNRHTRILATLFLVIFCLPSVSPSGAADQTLVCDYCGKSLSGAYIVNDSGKYHESCYEDHVAPRCGVCGQVIDGEYFIDHWGNFVHVHHGDEVPRCEYCNRFISEYITGGGYKYSDGRFICRLCDKQAVRAINEARHLMETTAAILKARGIEIDIADIPLHLVDKREMARLRRDERGDPHGFTYVEVTTTIGGIVTDRKFEIYMLTAMPRMHFIATLAHELMHVWLHENAPQDIEAAFCEGSCNYASFLVLEDYPGKETDYIKASLENDPDPVYGDGFRRTAQFVDKRGIEAWLTYLRMNNYPPW